MKMVGKDGQENKQMWILCFTYCKTNLFHVNGNIKKNLLCSQMMNISYLQKE